MASKHELVAKIVAKADSDDAFRKQLKADPVGTIKSMGYTTRPGVAVKVLETPAGPRVKAEFEDVRRAARELGRPALEVAREVETAARALVTPSPRGRA